jgi:DNA-binding NarL/FixJ family response regulator
VKKSKKLVFDFTPQEMAVAGFIANGTPLKDISGQMKISINTVKVYLSNIRKKTGTHSVYQAGTLLARNGY